MTQKGKASRKTASEWPATPNVSPATLHHIATSLRPLAVPLDTLALDPKNARTHDDANLKAIAASLREFGQVRPIVVNKSNRQIEAGNGTYLAAQSLGWTHIAAVEVEHDARQQRGFALADNRTAELAKWDQVVLDELLSSIREDNDSLYVDLQLADLESAAIDEPAKASPSPSGKMKTFQVVVECEDAADRRRLMASLRKQGRRCRALTWEGDEQMAAVGQ